jgi:hypothetical protein
MKCTKRRQSLPPPSPGTGTRQLQTNLPSVSQRSRQPPTIHPTTMGVPRVSSDHAKSSTHPKPPPILHPPPIISHPLITFRSRSRSPSNQGSPTLPCLCRRGRSPPLSAPPIRRKPSGAHHAKSVAAHPVKEPVRSSTKITLPGRGAPWCSKAEREEWVPPPNRQNLVSAASPQARDPLVG